MDNYQKSCKLELDDFEDLKKSLELDDKYLLLDREEFQFHFLEFCCKSMNDLPFKIRYFLNTEKFKKSKNKHTKSFKILFIHIKASTFENEKVKVDLISDMEKHLEFFIKNSGSLEVNNQESGSHKN